MNITPINSNQNYKKQAFGMALQKPFSEEARNCILARGLTWKDAQDLTSAIERVNEEQLNNKLFDIVTSTEKKIDCEKFVAQVVRNDNGETVNKYTGLIASDIIEALRSASSMASLRKALESDY